MDQAGCFENSPRFPQRGKSGSIPGFALLSLRSRNHARSAFHTVFSTPSLILFILMIFICFLGASLLSTIGFSSPQVEKKALEGRISISGAWALYPMAVKWAEEFQKIHPRVIIDVQAGGAGKGIADALAGMVDIGMVSRGINQAEVAKGAFAVAVTKDAVVPTINEKSPFITELLKKGVKREQFIDIWITKKIKAWGQVLGTGEEAPIHLYTRSDACGAAETWAEFLGKRQEDLEGTGVYGDPGLADAVKRDSLGIGYNNINYAYDAKTKRAVKGIMILPLDLDRSGWIENDENFYGTRDEIVQAIATDIYPSPPARDLYFVTKGKPKNLLLMEFIKWVLTEGQNFVPETGYIALSQRKLTEGLEKVGEK
jgi:phosphate transport system substrate-binding protein